MMLGIITEVKHLKNQIQFRLRNRLSLVCFKKITHTPWYQMKMCKLSKKLIKIMDNKLNCYYLKNFKKFLFHIFFFILFRYLRCKKTE